MRKERGCLICKDKKRGQIWVETVIYTLIAFTLIGLVLAFVKPKIEEIQDRGIIEQSIDVLEEINSVIGGMGTAGNKRVVNIGINKGTLNIDGANDKIFFTIGSGHEYSELNQVVNNGNVDIYTAEEGSKYKVNLILDYTDKYNIKFQNGDTLRKINKASTPYKVSISEGGLDALDNIIINFDIVN